MLADAAKIGLRVDHAVFDFHLNILRLLLLTITFKLGQLSLLLLL